MAMAQSLCQEEVAKCLDLLDSFEDNDGTEAIRNLATSLSTPA